MEKTKIKVMGIEMDDVSEDMAERINQRYEKIGKRFPFQEPEKLRMLAIREFICEIDKMQATISYLNSEVKRYREKEIERLEIKSRLEEDED